MYNKIPLLEKLKNRNTRGIYMLKKNQLTFKATHGYFGDASGSDVCIIVARTEQ